MDTTGYRTTSGYSDVPTIDRQEINMDKYLFYLKK